MGIMEHIAAARPFIPYVHVDYNTCPITVAWRRLTLTGRKTYDWHIVVLKRYKKGDLIPGSGREYLPTKFHAIRKDEDAIAATMIEDPPKKLPLNKGVWSSPVVREFIQPEAKDFPASFVVRTGSAMS